MATVVDNSLFILYTEFNFFFFFSSFDTCVFMARLHTMPCRIHPCLSYLDFREGNCLSHHKSGKT